jgi:EmrB/QacA subfamily drug resistance transporter
MATTLQPALTAAAAPAPMSTNQRVTLVATGLGLFMIFLDALIVNVALPVIQADFQVGESGLQWVVTTYSIGMAVAIMSAATLADLHGRRKLYIIGIALFTASSIACGMAPTLDALNVARTIQGIAAATVNVTSLALVSAAFPDPKQKARAIGIWTAIASTATAIGPTLGGLLVQTSGWRSIFLVNVPVGVLAIVLTVRFVAESRDPRERRFDLPGQLLFALAVGSFAYAVIDGPKVGWLSTRIVALFAVAVAALAAFIRFEHASPDPMMDIALFRDRTYSLAIATIFSVLFSIYGMLLVTTQYMQNVRGYSPTDTGLLLLPFSATMTIVSLTVGHLVGKFGTRSPILAGLASLIVGLVIMIAGMPTSVVVVVVGLVFASLGGAACLTPITTLAMTSVPHERAGMASGIMSAQRAIGSTVGFAVLGSILAAWLAATLDRDLATALPDRAQRGEVVAVIVKDANPRAYAAEIGPGRPITHADPVLRDGILRTAAADFVQGIRLALACAIALLAIVLTAGIAWFPRHAEAIAQAEQEASTLERREESPSAEP